MQFLGTVVGTKMMKTAKVEVTRMVLHPHVIKYIKRRKKFLCHDEAQRCRVGDLVLIKECAAVSKRKHFKVAEILDKTPAHLVEEQRQMQGAGPGSQGAGLVSQEARPGSQGEGPGSQEMRPGSQGEGPGSQETRPGSQGEGPGSQEARPGSPGSRPGPQGEGPGSVTGGASTGSQGT